MKKKNQTQRRTAPTPIAPPPPPAPVKILSFDALQTLCTQERECRLVINGNPAVVMVRSLTPAESLKVADILRHALPPRVKATEQGAEDTLDLEDPTYKEARKKHQAQARALAIFLGCPVYRQEILKLSGVPDVPGVMPAEGSALNLSAIAEVVQQRLTERVVEQIYTEITEIEGSAAEYADFFSAASARS